MTDCFFEDFPRSFAAPALQAISGKCGEKSGSNRTKSKTRAQVEHVFGTWTMQMGGKLLRSIGLVRAKAHLGLKNLTYNLMRYTFWKTHAVA